MIAQSLFVAGATIFGILGTLHLAFTFFSNKFNAYDQSVTAAMKMTSPIISKETTMWKAWIGFNASHSLGAILVAAFYIPLSLGNMDVILGNPWFSVLPVVFGLAYLWLAKRYWFKIPFIGILIATTCFVGAAFFINIY